MKICCSTGKGFAVTRSLVGRAICFNEKVISEERKEPGCRLFVHGFSFSSEIKSTRTYVSTCVSSVWVYRSDHWRKESSNTARFEEPHTLIKQSITKTGKNIYERLEVAQSTRELSISLGCIMSNTFNWTYCLHTFLAPISSCSHWCLFTFFQTEVEPDNGGWSGLTKQLSYHLWLSSCLTLNLRCSSRNKTERQRLSSLRDLEIQLGGRQKRTVRDSEREKEESQSTDNVTFGLPLQIECFRVVLPWNL